MTTTVNRRLKLVGCLVLLCVAARVAIAQPPPPLPGESGNSADGEAGLSEGTPPSPDEPPVRRIYVPTRELDALLKADRQGVLLPNSEFRRLFEAAKAAEESELRTPAGLVMAAANYAGRIDEDRLHLTVRVRLRQFEEGWQVLRLPLGGLSLRSATLDGMPAPVARDAQNRNTLLVFTSQTGEHELTLELEARLKSLGSDALAEFQVVGAPSGRLTLNIPEGKSLLVDGLTYEPSAADADAEYAVPLGGRSQISLRLTDRDLKKAADSLVFANTAYGLQVAPGEVTWATQTSVQTYGQSLNQLAFSVPKALEVAAVESTGLEEWTLSETDSGRRTLLTLTYRQPFDGERSVSIRGVLVPEGEEWTVPNLQLQSADSHAGMIVVKYGPEVRLQAEYGDEVRPLAGDGKEGSAKSETEGMRSLRFRTMTPTFDLRFRTLGKQRSVQVAMTNLLDVSDDGLELQTLIDVQTYFAPLFDVRVTLPADFEITAAAVSDSPTEWSTVPRTVGVIEVRIPLDPPLKPGQTRRVSLSSQSEPEDWPVERDAVLLPFPEVGLPQAGIIEARYGIMAEADLEVRTLDLTGLDPAQQADAAGLQQAASAVGKQLRLGFNYQDSVFSGQLEITRKPTRLAVSTLSLSRVEPQTVRTDLRAFVTVEGGGTQGLLIQLPESAGTDLRFRVEPLLPPPAITQAVDFNRVLSEPVSIVEQTVSDPVDGQRIWALRFDRRMRGSHVIRVSLVQPRTPGVSVRLPAVGFTGAERQNGWLAVEAREKQRLLVQATDAGGQSLLKVDAIDLPGMGEDVADQRRIVAAFRYVRPGYSVSIQEQEFDAVAVPTAIADRFETRTVWSETGLLQHQLDMTFRTVGVQSLRFVLPPDADVWAVLIDAVPVDVRSASGTFQVPLPASADPADARSLRLIYRSLADDVDAVGRLQQSPPLIAAVSGSGRLQPLEVLQQEWTLHYPRDVILLDSSGLFSPSGELGGEGWLSDAGGAITLPTLAEAGRRIGIAAAVVIAIWVVVLVWRRFGYWSLPLLGVGIPVVAIGTLFVLFASRERSADEYFARTEAPEAAAVDLFDMEATEESREMGEAQTPAAAFEKQRAADDAAISDPPAPESYWDAPPPMVERRRQMLQEPVTNAFDSAGRFDGISDRLGGLAGEQAASAGAPLLPARARGALLSLSLDLEAPVGSRSRKFHSLAPPSDTGPTLEVTYSSRSFREVIVLVLASGLAVLCWIARRASAKVRLGVVLFAVVVPIALAPVVPASWTMIVEGLLLGGLAGAALWALRALVHRMARWCERWCPTAWTAKHSAADTAVGLLLLVAAGTTFGSSCQAQPPQRPANQMGTVPASGDLPTVIVPYEGDPLAAERVYLPQELFRKLWLKANPDQRPRAPAPIDGLVAEALYSVEVGGDQNPPDAAGQTQVPVRARFVVFSFREKPVWLPLPLNEVAVTSATLDEGAAVLRPGERHRPELLVRSAGMHVLDLQFDIPAEVRQNSGQLTLPLLPAASGSLTLTLPPSETERSIRAISDGDRVTSRTIGGDEGRTRTEFAIDAGGAGDVDPLRISWQPTATRGGSDGIVHVDSRTALEIADDGVQMTAEFALQVRQGTLAETRFQFPDAVRLKRITGPDVGGWKIDGAGEQRTLTIFLRRNVDDKTTITAELFVPQENRSEEFEFAVPAFAPLDTTRETGQIAVLAQGRRDVRATAVEGLRQIDRTALTRPAGGPDTPPESAELAQLAYRFTSRPWQLVLSVSQQPPVAAADSEHGVFVGRRQVTYSSRIRYDLAGAPRQTLRIALADDFLLTSLVGDGIEDWVVEDAELLIDLGQPRLGRVDVVLQGHTPRDPQDAAAVVITPLPLELDRQQSVLAVWIDSLYSATLDSFDTWRTIDRAELAADMTALHSGEPQFAFRSRAVEPEIVNLDLIRQQPQIIADAVSLIAVTDASVDYGLTLRWTIERAATDVLVFTVPGWLQDRLDLTGDNIRQTTQELTDEGRVRWTVRLRDALRGQYLLTAAATLPPPEDGIVRAPGVQFELPPSAAAEEFAAVASQQSFAVLVNLSRGRLSAVGDARALTVRREQLPLVLRNDLLAQAMALVRLPATTQAAWTFDRVPEQSVPPANVSAARLTTVLAIDGSLRTRAQYRVRNRGQQFLALVLPETSGVLSVLVKEQPARCLAATIGKQPVTLVPLPQTSEADLSFLVELVLQDRLDGVTRLDAAALGREINLPAPAVISPRQSAEFGATLVHTSWTVYLPQDLDVSIVEDDSNMSLQPAEAADVQTELQLYRELADLNRLLMSKKLSVAQRRKVAGSVDQLGKELQQNGVPTPRFRLGELDGSFSAEDRGLAMQKDELLMESVNNLKQAQQDLSRDGQVLEGEAAITNSFGRSFIAGNSAYIRQDNFGDGAVIAGEKLKGFRFDSSAVDKKTAAAKEGRDPSKPADFRTKLREQLDTQLPVQRLPASPFIPLQPMGSVSGVPNRNAGDDLQMFGGIFADFDENGPRPGLPPLAALGAPSAWFETGGLSLPIELPTRGQTLTFTTLERAPQLSLAVRPRESGHLAVRWLWAVVVLAAGAWLLHQLAHRASIQDSPRLLSLSFVALGLILLLCLPLPTNLFGGLLLIVGALVALLNWQPSRPQP